MTEKADTSLVLARLSEIEQELRTLREALERVGWLSKKAKS